MTVAPPVDQTARRPARVSNYWPLAGAALCLALWWPIIAAVFNARAANTFVAAVACILVIAIAQALRYDALRAGYEPLRLRPRADLAGPLR